MSIDVKFEFLILSIAAKSSRRLTVSTLLRCNNRQFLFRYKDSDYI